MAGQDVPPVQNLLLGKTEGKNNDMTWFLKNGKMQRIVCISCKDGKGCNGSDDWDCHLNGDLPFEVAKKVSDGIPQTEIDVMIYGNIKIVDKKGGFYNDTSTNRKTI